MISEEQLIGIANDEFEISDKRIIAQECEDFIENVKTALWQEDVDTTNRGKNGN